METERHMLGNTCAGDLRQVGRIEQQKIRTACSGIQDHRQQYAIILGSRIG